MSAQSDEPFIARASIDAEDRTTTVDIEKPKTQPKPMNINEQPQSDNPQPDFISFFKGKLKDPKQNCLCKYCTLWFSVHIVWGLLLLNVLSVAMDTMAAFDSGHIIWGALQIFYLCVQIPFIALSVFGVYKCKPSLILPQYIFVLLVWMPLLKIVMFAVPSQDITFIVFQHESFLCDSFFLYIRINF